MIPYIIVKKDSHKFINLIKVKSTILCVVIKYTILGLKKQKYNYIYQFQVKDYENQYMTS